MAVHRPTHDTLAALYVRTPASAARLALLKDPSRQAETLPLSLVADVLELELPVREIAAVLARCAPDPGDARERMLLGRLAALDQRVGLHALDSWRRHTERLLWRDLIALVPDLAGRQSYVEWLLEHAWAAGGAALLEALRANVRIDDCSEEAQTLFFERFVQWNLEDEDLLLAAERLLARSFVSTILDHRVASACAYVARFRPETLFDVLSSPALPRHSADAVAAHHHLWLSRAAVVERLAALCRQPPPDDADFFRELYRLWPPTWLRAGIPQDVAAPLLRDAIRRSHEGAGRSTSRPVTWHLAAGLSREALDAVADRAILGGLLTAPGGDAPPAVRPPRPDHPVRVAFFDRFYRGKTSPVPKEDSPWRALLVALEQPAPEDFSQACAKLPALFRQVAWRLAEARAPDPTLVPGIATLLPTFEPHELLLAARALIAIGTGEAHTYVIRLMAREDMDPAAVVGLCQLLAGRDLRPLRGDLQGVAATLGSRPGALTAPRLEAIDAVGSLLRHEAAPRDEALLPAGVDAGAAGADVARLIPRFPSLPPDVARALRTARAVQRTFGSALDRGDLDASPAVELQYKAIELLLRQRYMARTQHAIDDPKAPLQRRLDAIGYGRYPAKVEAFESSLANLPVIRDIPAFSRVKLNRLLSSLCQHRPGRRFTLDGGRAYALFFLAFGRERCEFGLAGLFPVGTRDDRALLELCRDIDMLHDLRNFAVHDGLASAPTREIDQLWGLTSSIIERIEAASGVP